MISEYNQLTLAIVSYRIISLLVGLASVYMGYRLFTLGVFKKAGELSADFGDKSLFVRGAPGTFLALFGTGIIIFSLYQGMEFQRVVAESSTPRTMARPSFMPLPEIRGILDKVLRGEKLTIEEENKLREFKKIELWKSRAIEPAS